MKISQVLHLIIIPVMNAGENVAFYSKENSLEQYYAVYKFHRTTVQINNATGITQQIISQLGHTRPAALQRSP